MGSAARSAFLTIATRWADRFIGLISTLVLARLLVPQDFGVIAMASMTIALVDVFLDLGVNVPLIQNRDATPDHFNTAWTLRIVQALLATAIVIVASPWAASYFHEPRVEPVIQILSIGFVIGAIENIGLVTFQRDMRFGKDLQFFLFRRLFGFAVTIAAAFILRSYWALVIGSLSGRLFGAILSYRMHPFRPRLSFGKVREIFGFSQWILVRNITLYLDNRLHQFVVGSRESSAVMGAYSLADDISAMPTTELLAPINRVLFPALVKVKHDLAELKRLTMLCQGIHSLVGIPAGVGLSVIANEMVIVLLGQKWLIAVPFVKVMALINAINSITLSGAYLLLTLGRVRLLAAVTVAQVLFFVSLAVFAIPRGGATQIAWLRLVVACGGLVVFTSLLLMSLRNISLREVAAVIVRPIVASAVMAVCVTYVGSLFTSVASILITKVAVGIVSYCATITLLWIAAGKPTGAESYLLGLLQQRPRFLKRV